MIVRVNVVLNRTADLLLLTVTDVSTTCVVVIDFPALRTSCAHAHDFSTK